MTNYFPMQYQADVEEIVKMKLEILTNKLRQEDQEILITENMVLDEDIKPQENKQDGFPYKGTRKMSIFFKTHINRFFILNH